MSGKRRKIISTGFMICLLLLWQIFALAIHKAYILPGPVDVLRNIAENAYDIFLIHLPATMKVVLIGGILSIIIGLCLAVLMDASPKIEKAVYPLLSISQTIPVMCIAPILVLWFGYSVFMRVVVVVLMNYFAVAINVFDGFREVDTGKIDLMKSYEATKLQQLIYLKMPGAVPHFFTALKIALPWSATGATISEWLGAPNGIGIYSRSCMMELNTAGLLAPLVVLTVIVILCSFILQRIEMKLTKNYVRK